MEIQNAGNPPSRLVVHGNQDLPYIALTYDAGAEDSETDAILSVLSRHHVSCTFFLTGVWAEKFPDLCKKIVYEGHEIGNHSYAHPDMAELTHDAMLETVHQGEQAIQNVTGVSPKPLFRQPFGSFNDAILRAVGEAGYPYSIYWDVDPVDWKLPSLRVIINRILYKVENGSIILLHLDGKCAAEATDSVIKNLKARGFMFVKVSELIARL